MEFAKLNGVTLHYRDTGRQSSSGSGSGSGHTILFANSLGTDFRIWDEVIGQLRGDFRCISYDKRGHGLSEAPPEPYVMDDHISDAAAILSLCGVDKAIVCGVSVGGLIAQGLAIHHADKVTGLVLCDTGAKIGDDDIWDSRIGPARQHGLEPLADAVMERWFPEAFRTSHAVEVAGYRAMMSRTPADGYIGTCCAIRDTDFREASKAISVPTLVIVGAEDGATPPALNRALAETIPGAAYEELPGVGHLPSLQEPVRVAELVRALAGRVD